MPIAREIGQIFANQINFRQSIKDRIEDYIQKTELAALDPAVIRQRQAEVNRMRDALSDLDKQIADISEKKIAGIDDIAQRWVAADGSVKAQEVAAGGRVESARIGAQSDLDTALIAARARIQEARIRGESEERVKQMEINANVLQGLRDEEKKGEAGAEQNLSKVIDAARTFPGQNVNDLGTALKNLWTAEFLPKYNALGGNELGKRRLSEKWAEAAGILVDQIGSPQGKQAVLDDLTAEGLSVTDLAFAVADLPSSFLQQDKQQMIMDAALQMGFQEPAARSAAQEFAGGRVGVSATRPIAKEIESASRAAQLGFQTDAQVKDFEELAAYNRYLVDKSDETGVAPTVTFEQFKASAAKGGPESAYIDQARKAGTQELAQYGDRFLVDLMLKRKGVASELADVKNAFAEAGSKFPSYESVQRKVLEQYSSLYGGRGQQRLVDLAKLGRATPLSIPTFKDSSGNVVQIGTPEYEILFRAYNEGKDIGPTAAGAGGTTTGGGGGGVGVSGVGRGIANIEDMPVVAPGGYPSTQKVDLSKYTVSDVRTANLDVPELEILFGKSGGGSRMMPAAPVAPAGESVRQSTVVMGLDQKGTARPSGMQSQGRAELSYVPKPTIKSGYELNRPFPEAEPELPFNPDLTGDQRGMGGRLPPYITEQPEAVRRQAVPGEIRKPTTLPGGPQTFQEATEMAAIVPTTDAARFKAAPVDASLLEAPAPVAPPVVTKPLEDMSSFELEAELKKAILQDQKLRAELEKADAERAMQIGQELRALQERARRIIELDKENPITKDDFDKLTYDELVAKVKPKAKPVTLSAAGQRMNQDLLTYAAGSTAASKAEKEVSKGKEASPAKFIKGADKLSAGQIATIKDLAQKRGTVKTADLRKTLAQIIGVDENSPLVEKAKSLFIAFEQLA